MSGHSKWVQIKHKKGITDARRGKIFSKLLAAITAAAKTEPNPQFNPRLRTAVEAARGAQVPSENIERAIRRAAAPGGVVEEVLMEAHGAGGAALLITAVTDNKNRTVPEVKKILSDYWGKWSEAGSVRWAFEPAPGGGFAPKFPVALSEEDKKKLAALIEALEDHDDVQKVYTNATEVVDVGR